MNRIHELAEISPLENNEMLIRYNGSCTYVRSYEGDGFRFHAKPFLSDWFDDLEKCKIAAIDYIFSSAPILVLLQKYICLLVGSPWAYRHSGGRLTIITPSGSVAVVDMSLKVIHATDDDIQCSIYGFIESINHYKNNVGQMG